MDTLKEAQRLHKLGFAILLLHQKSKRPKASKWTTGDRQSFEEIKKAYQSGDNIGVRTGLPSKVGAGYLACIDVDIKNPAFKDRALSKVSELIGLAQCPEVRSGSGQGSRHFYCITKRPFKMLTIEKNENFEICVYSNGRQMVLPPSIHPSGKAYKWGFIPLLKAQDLPLIEFDIPQMGYEKKPRTTTVIKPKDAPFAFKWSKVEIDWLPISHATIEGIKKGTGVTDRSAFLLHATTALFSSGLDKDEILSVLTNPTFYISSASRERRGKNRQAQAAWLWEYTVKKIIEERSAQNVFSKVPKVNRKLTRDAVINQTSEILSDRDFRQDLDKGLQGKAKPTLKNLNIILSNVVPGALFKKDMFANRIAYGIDAPWGPKAGDYLQDIDAVLIKHWLGTGEFNFEPKKESLFEVTDLIAHRERTHPVREWLQNLKWDGRPRISKWIRDFCQGEAEEPYLSEVSQKFLLAMVKRVFEPGCQWDYTLVFEGDQGKYKSSIARALASDKWFLDNLPDLRDKDAMLNLQGKWLIELGELTNVKRSDFNLVKQYLVRRIDTVRPHYGRIMSDVPRQSVFIGTVNDGQYLKDPTGNRRFWPVKVGECDVRALEKVRDQLFAEAYHIYKTKNEVLMLSPKADKQALEAQDDRRIEDDHTAMEDALREFMKSEAGKNFNFEKFRSKELFTGTEAPWGPWASKNYATQTAAQVLHNMGFIRVMIHGQRIWRSPEGVKRTQLFIEKGVAYREQTKRSAPHKREKMGAGEQGREHRKIGGLLPPSLELDFY